MMMRTQPQKFSLLPILISVFVIMLLGAGGYALYTLFTQQRSDIGIREEKIKIRSVDWEKTLFQRPDFQALKSNLNGPIESGVLGNKHPFERKSE